MMEIKLLQRIFNCLIGLTLLVCIITVSLVYDRSVDVVKSFQLENQEITEENDFKVSGIFELFRDQCSYSGVKAFARNEKYTEELAVDSHYIVSGKNTREINWTIKPPKNVSLETNVMTVEIEYMCMTGTKLEKVIEIKTPWDRIYDPIILDKG